MLYVKGQMLIYKNVNHDLNAVPSHIYIVFTILDFGSKFNHANSHNNRNWFYQVNYLT